MQKNERSATGGGKMNEDKQFNLKAALEEEKAKLDAWYDSEMARIEREAREKGLWMDSGLDSNQWLLKDFYAELRARLKEIREKYDLEE